MTDRTERGSGPRGRKQGPRRPGAGGRPPRAAAPRTEGRDADRSSSTERGSGARADGKPYTKRYGKGSPSSFQKGGADPRRERPASEERSNDRPSSGERGTGARAGGKPYAKPFGKGSASSFRKGGADPRRERPASEERSSDRPSSGERGTGARADGKPHSKRFGQGSHSSYRKGGTDARSERPTSGERAERPSSNSRPDGSPHSKRFGKRPPAAGRGKSAPPDERPRNEGDRPSGGDFARGGDRRFRTDRPLRGDEDRGSRREIGRGPDRGSKRGRKAEDGIGDGRIRLNRFLSNAGVASRREADDLIKAGVVTVNGKVVTEMGTKVSPTDVVHYGGQKLSTEKKRYVLLNKPKDFITTTDDPRDRRTVMALIDDACTERLYPVGRLDRNTTGLLLMTNDGDLAKKLTHPSFGAEKIYHVTLDKNVTKADLEQLVKGVQLDDGPATADEASFVNGATKKEIGMKLHMGRNRIVRRMFEALGYEVLKLDRVAFAGLTKKELPRGNWRHLTEKEVLFLTKRK